MQRVFLDATSGPSLETGSPATHLAVRQNDFCDAANHGDEVKDIPGVSEVVLPREVSHGGIRKKRRKKKPGRKEKLGKR